MTRETKSTGLYATASDFCRIFQEDMGNLYSLALLLTADSEKAEQCFVSGLEHCTEGNLVFKEWARSWARRTIIKGAIRLVALNSTLGNVTPTLAANAQPIPAGLRPEMSALLSLGPLDRFAFVTSVLEGYNDRDCALLLGCTQDSLVAARTRAIQQIASRGSSLPEVPSVTSSLGSPVLLAIPA